MWCRSPACPGTVRLIGECDEQHRDERQHEHRRRLFADGENDIAQRGGQAVRGSDRRESDDDIADEAECAGLQALVADGLGRRFDDCHARKYTVLVVATGVQRGNRSIPVVLLRNQSRLPLSYTGFMTASTRVDEFEGLRPHLLSVAYRLTGTVADAEDIVQDAWLRWNSRDVRRDQRSAGLADDGGEPAEPGSAAFGRASAGDLFRANGCPSPW